MCLPELSKMSEEKERMVERQKLQPKGRTANARRAKRMRQNKRRLRLRKKKNAKRVYT